MSDNERERQFVTQLRRMAKKMPHSELARKLGIPRWKLRNWCYRDGPNSFAAQVLKPKLDRLEKP